MFGRKKRMIADLRRENEYLARQLEMERRREEPKPPAAPEPRPKPTEEEMLEAVRTEIVRKLRVRITDNAIFSTSASITELADVYIRLRAAVREKPMIADEDFDDL